MRRAIAEKINRLPLGYFDGHSQGDTLSRVTNDVDTAAQSLNQSLGTVLSSTLLVVAVLVTMFGMNLDFSLSDGCFNSYRFSLRVRLYGQIARLL